MKRKRLSPAVLIYMVLTIIFYGFLPISALAQNIPDSTENQRQLVRRISQRFNISRWIGYVDISVTPEGVISSLRGTALNMGLTATDIVGRASQFFERNSDILGFDTGELVLRGSWQAENGWGVVDFDQEINGVKVLWGEYHVYFTSDSSGAQIYNIDGQFYPEARNINTTPTIDSGEAGRIAQSDPAHGDKRTHVFRPELLIANFPDGLHLAWHLYVSGGGYDGSGEYFVDAHNGAILKVTSAIRY